MIGVLFIGVGFKSVDIGCCLLFAKKTLQKALTSVLGSDRI